MATKVRLQSRRHLPRNVVEFRRVRRTLLRGPGCVGVGVMAVPSIATFWSFSAWADRASLDTAIGHHRETTMTATLSGRVAISLVVVYTVPTGEVPPHWGEVQARLRP
ncbi:hypothetical protein [Antrihabitans cavernicola]|uniref:ABM domain-containing protein n=1 Tax=Antrihabitans cavernicola TaxID=2495913 RepID=A0A5A7S254_9NOCA|nr:hypothetical protein [Spelaeibacter cavernicola]KAA0017007.1 hypothetical protein FOY51_25535 [Spelaeibacter cavernicola]